MIQHSSALGNGYSLFCNNIPFDVKLFLSVAITGYFLILAAPNLLKWLVIALIVREEEVKKVCKSNMRGGNREVTLGFSVGPENPVEKSVFNLVATVNLDPGASVGYHVHEDDEELYHILSGNGVYNDNGTEVEVKRGDAMICRKGEGHSITNTGKEPMIFMAVVAS
jgi:mannose-6-phosphate isomerase-like protein (cupin superfamily)